jgi:hypothetical protein
MKLKKGFIESKAELAHNYRRMKNMTRQWEFLEFVLDRYCRLNKKTIIGSQLDKVIRKISVRYGFVVKWQYRHSVLSGVMGSYQMIHFPLFIARGSIKDWGHGA